MSTVKDSQGNILNNPGPGCGRYTDANATEIDWFATHPRPVEKAKTEFHVTEVPATLPPNSGDTLKVVAPVIGEYADWDAAQGAAIDHSIATGEPLFAETLSAETPSAGVTTPSLPQTTVVA